MFLSTDRFVTPAKPANSGMVILLFSAIASKIFTDVFTDVFWVVLPTLSGFVSYGGIQQLAVSEKIQFFKGIGNSVELKAAELQEGFQLACADIIYGRLTATLCIPAEPVPVLLNNQLFKFIGA